MFEPVVERGKPLSDELKFILRDKNALHHEAIYDEGQLGYLVGLRDGGVQDAEKLIEAIDKFGSVRVWLQS